MIRPIHLDKQLKDNFEITHTVGKILLVDMVKERNASFLNSLTLLSSAGKHILERKKSPLLPYVYFLFIFEDRRNPGQRLIFARISFIYQNGKDYSSRNVWQIHCS